MSRLEKFGRGAASAGSKAVATAEAIIGIGGIPLAGVLAGVSGSLAIPAVIFIGTTTCAAGLEITRRTLVSASTPNNTEDHADIVA